MSSTVYVALQEHEALHAMFFPSTFVILRFLLNAFLSWSLIARSLTDNIGVGSWSLASKSYAAEMLIPCHCSLLHPALLNVGPVTTEISSCFLQIELGQGRTYPKMKHLCKKDDGRACLLLRIQMSGRKVS